MTSFDFALWSADKAYGKSRLRSCFASPSHDELRQGMAVLAEVCRREFGVPTRIGNIEQWHSNRKRGE